MKRISSSQTTGREIIREQRGLTLIELMVCLAIFSMLVGTIYSAYRSQLSSHVTQQRIVDMQQNIRGALAIMEQDIRVAGWPSDGTADTGILNAAANNITVAMDMRSCDNCPDGEPDGDVNDAQETVRYFLVNNDLMRQSGNQAPQSLAANIDALAFAYFDGSGASMPAPLNGNALHQVKTVQVTLIARDGANEAVLARDHTDDTTYAVGDAVILDQSAAPDGFRRIMLTSRIVCQNL